MLSFFVGMWSLSLFFTLVLFSISYIVISSNFLSFFSLSLFLSLCIDFSSFSLSLSSFSHSRRLSDLSVQQIRISDLFFSCAFHLYASDSPV